RWFAPARHDVAVLGPTEGETVVDLGAGVGFHGPETLARLGPHGTLYLVDVDRRNLEIARARISGDTRVRCVVASAANVETVPSQSVDRILFSLALCCLVEKEAAMDEVWRMLKPGGRALVTYPRWRAPWKRGPSLRVTSAHWRGLVARHPWELVSERTGWAVVRHLLERPRSAPETT
ncbi:MAG TPA: class I SAM-dependent methyltransferase, partial [Thermoplasmata archaeon]|nr:class I SAM-dependent methyltransferase [Thermoplasmata archaeon]